MPVIDVHSKSLVVSDQIQSWKPIHRIENTGGDTGVVSNAIQTYPFDKLIYAEGDSWFDKFTPLPSAGANILDALRLPVFAGVVDVSHIGDVSSELVRGWQRRQTRAMFKLFDFDAILVSAGGNDLKNLFAELYDQVAEKEEKGLAVKKHEVEAIANESLKSDLFKDILENIKEFVALRDASKRERTRLAPILLHGYDYMQPRPASAKIFSGTKLGSGPWIYPSLKRAGLSDTAMLDIARQVIDTLNDQLRAWVFALPAHANIWFLDQRGILTVAEAGTDGASGDWMDEIHATEAGYKKLADLRWSPWLASILKLL